MTLSLTSQVKEKGSPITSSLVPHADTDLTAQA